MNTENLDTTEADEIYLQLLVDEGDAALAELETWMKGGDA